MFRNLVNRVRRLFDTETGDVLAVTNQGRHRAANPFYFAARLRAEGDGSAADCYLFTGNELETARVRAVKNPEDLPWCNTKRCECSTPS